jgi:recombinational DNA repair ATPase RecF
MKCKNLIRFLKDIPAQIFLTATDLDFPEDFGARRLHVFHVENGKVHDSREIE